MRRRYLKHFIRFLSLVLAFTGMLATASVPANAASGSIRITVDGTPIYTDTAPFVDANSRTMVPVRFISEALNAEVQWNELTSTVTVNQGSTVITLQIGSRELIKNGSVTMMDTEAVMMDARTFVPVRFIAEALGLNVGWDEAANTVRLNTGDTSNAAPSPLTGSEAVYLFSTIVGHNEKVYSIYAAPEKRNFEGIRGSTKFTHLPEVIYTYLESVDLYVYNFTIYQNKIYYLAAEAGSVTTRGEINRCNLDGSQNEWVADANNLSACMISDGWLYFNAETDEGAIINYAKDLNSAMLKREIDFPEYPDPGIVYYNGFIYYFSDDTLYKKDVLAEAANASSGSEFISALMTLTQNSMNLYDEGFVVAVANDTVYYATLGDYGADDGTIGNTYLFGVSIYGGASELLATWFTP